MSLVSALSRRVSISSDYLLLLAYSSLSLPPSVHWRLLQRQATNNPPGVLDHGTIVWPCCGTCYVFVMSKAVMGGGTLAVGNGVMHCAAARKVVVVVAGRMYWALEGRRNCLLERRKRKGTGPAL